MVARRDELRQRVDDLDGARPGRRSSTSCAVRQERVRMLERHLGAASVPWLSSRGRRSGCRGSPSTATRGGSSTDTRRRRAAGAGWRGSWTTLSPLGILARGYSICFALPGRTILKAAAEVPVGSPVAVRLHRGELHCLVREVHSPEDAT